MKTFLYSTYIALLVPVAFGGILLEWDPTCGADALDDVRTEIAFWVYKEAMEYVDEDDIDGGQWTEYPSGIITEAVDIMNAETPEDLDSSRRLFLREQRRLKKLYNCDNKKKCKKDNSCITYCYSTTKRRELNNGKGNGNGKGQSKTNQGNGQSKTNQGNGNGKEKVTGAGKAKNASGNNGRGNTKSKDPKALEGKIKGCLGEICTKCEENNLPCSCALRNYTLTVE